MGWSLPRRLEGGSEEPRLTRDAGAYGLDEELLEVGEDEALRRVVDDLNRSRLARQLWLLAFVTLLYTMSKLVEGPAWIAAAAGVAAAADLLLARRLRTPAVARNIRQVCAAVLILHLLLFQLFHGLGSEALGLWAIAFALLATRFRLSPGESLALFGSLYAIVAVRELAESYLTKEGLPIAALIGFGLVHSGGFVLSWWLGRRHASRFLSRWRAESVRHLDRLRMKRELEYAREIQLSMLPRRAPRVDWLEIASLSLPATEVGGDYYDYFRLDDRRLAVVVGDVTGHGVASGLVLSGVRSCLNLLYEDLARPAETLAKVNRMLKRTTPRRMLMTLSVVVLDGAEGSLTVSTAGHPPVLVARAGHGVVEEVGQGALPLGALAESHYVERRVQLARGDVALVFSDGLVETVNADGEQFGWGRLRAVMESSVNGLSAQQVRDTILTELWGFKGETAQVDDVTMVVVRCTEDEAGTGA